MITLEKITAEALYEKLRNVKVGDEICDYTLEKCAEFVPLINEINELKQQQNAVILAHTYVNPEIIYGVGDFVGDSYGLSKNAMGTDAEKIVFAAVRFMAETAKILNPQKEVLLPALDAGCTLADAITAEQVRELRKEYPDYTFVCYINTTVDVKAECDVCVTSGNITDIICNIPNEKIYFVPDRLMAKNLIKELKKRGVKKDLKYFTGTCYVHEEFQLEGIRQTRERFPGVKILSHPECPVKICEESDFVGSTAQMYDYVKNSSITNFLMLTECGLATRMTVEMPEKRFWGQCALCKYMKSNSLQDILRVLKNPTDRDRVTVDEDKREKALKCIEAMFYYNPKK